MQYLKKIFVICMFIGIEQFTNSEISSLPNTYKGVQITPHTIFDLMPKMEQDIGNKVCAWLHEVKVQDMLHRLTNIHSLVDWQQERAAQEAHMESIGYHNISHNNYTARIPGVPYLFKIAGPKNRLMSMLATQGINTFDSNETSFHEALEKLNNQVTPTYQTASRAAYYLLLKDKHYMYVNVPLTYLMRISQKKGSIADDNAFIVQAFIPDAVKLVEKQDLIKQLPRRAADELYDAVVTTGIWNLRDTILINPKGDLLLTSGLHIVGPEQPANTSAMDFFHKNKDRFDTNVLVGLKQLIDLFESNSNLKSYIKAHIKRDNRLPKRTKDSLL